MLVDAAPVPLVPLVPLVPRVCVTSNISGGIWLRSTWAQCSVYRFTAALYSLSEFMN